MGKNERAPSLDKFINKFSCGLIPAPFFPHTEAEFEEKDIIYERDFVFFKEKKVHLLMTYTKKSGNKGEDDYLEEYIYDLNTNQFSGSISYPELLSLSSIVEFIFPIIEADKYLWEALEELWKNSDDISHLSWMCCSSPKSKSILFALGTTKRSLFEKLIKSSPSLFRNIKSFETIDVSQNQIKTAIGIPLNVLKSLELQGFSKSVSYFKNLCENGNDANILLDFISNLKSLIKRKRNYQESVDKILNNFAKLKETDQSYNISEILKYTLNQLFYHHVWSLDELLKLSETFSDYVAMKVEYEVQERFPSNLSLSHDILARNVKSYSIEENKAFEEKARDLIVYETKIKIDKQEYLFMVPKTIKELIKEGTSLKHCIASWVKRIINGNAIVLFVRKTKSPDESFVTINIEQGVVVEAKGEFNTDMLTTLDPLFKKYEKVLKGKV